MSILNYKQAAKDIKNAIVGATPSYGPGKMTNNGYTGMGTLGQTSTGNVKGYTQQSVNPYSNGSNPARDMEQKARAEWEANAEARAKEAEEKARLEQEKEQQQEQQKQAEANADNEILDLLKNYATRADNKTAQQSMQSVNDGQYEQLGRAASMAAAVNDDLTEALETQNAIRDSNRAAEYQSAIDRGVALLQSRNEEEKANQLKEAAKLQSDATTMSNIANTGSSLIELWNSLRS